MPDSETNQEHEVASLDDLAPGTMRRVQAGEEAILLVRTNDAVHAVGAKCPHAGAPLAEGVLSGTRIVCPWHKATFCARTGELLEPPAVDDLQRYEIRVDGNRIFVSQASAPKQPATSQPDTRLFVIVGAGAAGAVAAQTLRRENFAGRIVMLDSANRVPYDRTILSKYALSGEKGAEKSPLQSQAFYRQHRIERHQAEITGIDADNRTITGADGEVFHYDKALLATGASPIQSDLPGVELAGVFTLRSREDADAILERAEQSERVVILGASFIGMEVAASLRERGLDVTVVGQDKTPFEKQLGAQIGSAFVTLHEQHGVEFRLNTKIEALEGENHVRAVVLASGERIPADLVVIGFGVKPATDYAKTLNLNEDGGIKVDATLQAAEHLYATGDIASFPDRAQGAPIRVEHWRVAQQHGRVAALNMLGRTTSYDAVPVFWTIHYMKRLDMVGHATQWDDIIVHGKPEEQDFLAYYTKNAKVIAAAGMGRDQQTAALIELFHQRDWTADELGESPAALLAPRTI